MQYRGGCTVSWVTEKILSEDFGTFSQHRSGACYVIHAVATNVVAGFLALTRECLSQSIAECSAEFRLPLRIAEEGIVERLAVVEDYFVAPALALQHRDHLLH